MNGEYIATQQTKTKETRTHKIFRLMRAGVKEVLPSTYSSNREKERRRDGMNQHLLRADSAKAAAAREIPMRGTDRISVQVKESFDVGAGFWEDESRKERNATAKFSILYDIDDGVHNVARLGFLATVIDAGRSLFFENNSIMFTLTDKWVFIPALGTAMFFTTHYALRSFIRFLEERARSKEMEMQRERSMAQTRIPGSGVPMFG